MSPENDAANGKIAIIGHDGHRAKMHYIEMWFETVMHTIRKKWRDERWMRWRIIARLGWGWMTAP